MSELKKPLDLWIVAMGDFFPPGVMENKEAAEMCVELTKRSNDPRVIHVREVMPDDFKTRYKLCDEHICNGQKLINARKALEFAKRVIKGPSNLAKINAIERGDK